MRNSKGQFVKGFGFWTGKKRPGLKSSTQFKKGLKPWNTGTHIMTNDALVRWRKENPNDPWKGRHGRYTLETIAKIKAARAKQKNAGFQKKEKHWNWKGGVTALRKQVQKLQLYKNWRTAVFTRDNFTCVLCGSKGYLHADHIKRYSDIIAENKITTVEEAKKCAELWDISNGRSLCVKCHHETDTFGNRA